MEKKRKSVCIPDFLFSFSLPKCLLNFFSNFYAIWGTEVQSLMTMKFLQVCEIWRRGDRLEEMRERHLWASCILGKNLCKHHQAHVVEGENVPWKGLLEVLQSKVYQVSFSWNESQISLKAGDLTREQRFGPSMTISSPSLLWKWRIISWYPVWTSKFWSFAHDWEVLVSIIFATPLGVVTDWDYSPP